MGTSLFGLFEDGVSPISSLITIARAATALVCDERVSVFTKILSVLVGLYAIFPLNIIPDFIPVIGQVDDVALLGIALAILLVGSPLDVVRDYIPNFRQK